MASHSPRNFFQKLPASEKAFKEALAKLSPAQKKALLLAPLSDTSQENMLTFIIKDGSLEHPANDSWRAPFLKIALEQIAEIEPNVDTLVDLLTSTNELGQTAFHKTLQAGGKVELFDLLLQKLYAWGGTQLSDDWLKTFLNQPLGAIDKDISQSLNLLNDGKVRHTKAQRVQSLSTENYKPADFEALEIAIDEIRPLLKEWLRFAPHPRDTQGTKTHEAMEAFARNPLPVTLDQPVIMQAFPGALFNRLLGLHQKLMLPAQQVLSNYVEGLLTQPDTNGTTAMDRTWQDCVMSYAPVSVDTATDSLGPLIARLDLQFRDEAIAVELVKKLLQVKGADGKLPLARFKYDSANTRNFYVEKFLQNLRKGLGTQEKFVLYMTEVIAPLLPPDYKIKPLSNYAPQQQRPTTRTQLQP